MTLTSNGWYLASKYQVNSTAHFQDLYLCMEEKLTFLQQWEVSRFFEPQGPLSPGDPRCISEKLLDEWSDRAPRDIYDILARIAAELDEYRDKELPAPTPPSFWHALEAAGGEEAADAAGLLVYRMKLEMKSNGEPILTVVSPIIGASRRLYRTQPARRLLRVRIDEDSERVIRDGQRPHNKTKLKNFLGRPIRHLATLYRPFFYQKGAIYFWAFQHGDISAFPACTVSSFLDELIPRNRFNANMSVAKYSARMSLWLSKTTPIIPVEDVRWVPDLTNHTLPIGAQKLEDIALNELGLGYVPSCLAGTYGGRSCVWAVDRDIETTMIGIFEEGQGEEDEVEKEEDDEEIFEEHDELLEEEPEILMHFTFQAFTGVEREELVKDVYIEKKDTQEHELPKYPEEVMTDGNALMSYGLALAVCEERKMEALPYAVQARIGGSKGLWTLQPHLIESDKSVWIEIRDSQHKYFESQQCDWMFEVVNCSGPSKSASIGPQLLGVLARSQTKGRNLSLLRHLSALLDGEVRKSISCLLNIKDRALLRKALESLDRRLQNRAGESSRDGAQMRFSSREEEDNDLQNVPASSAGDVHALSGQPTTLAAQAIKLIESGFDLEDPTLTTLLEKLLHSSIDTNVASQRISVPSSRVLYVATDTLGLLEEGQVFIQLSEGSIIDEKTKRRRNGILKGPILITRSPCVQPTDIQKVHAVDIPDYHNDAFDVIICSTRGRRALLSMLSGGDYDGDTGTIIFDPDITSRWENVRLEPFLNPPYEESEYWDPLSVEIDANNVETVEELEEALEPFNARARDEHLSQIMLSSLYTPTHYGMLSEQHKSLLQKYGPWHDETIRMGHLYCQALDAGKAGKSFKQDRFKNTQSRDRIGNAHSAGDHSPSKQAAEEIGDLSLEEAAADWGEVDEDQEYANDDARDELITDRPPLRRSERLQNARGEIQQRQGEEAGSEEPDQSETLSEMDDALADATHAEAYGEQEIYEEQDMHEEQEASEADGLLNVDAMRSKAKSLKAEIARKSQILSDEDLKSVWDTLYTKEKSNNQSKHLNNYEKEKSDTICKYLDDMLAHVKHHADQFFKLKWLTAPPPPELARDVSAQEQVRKKRTYWHKRDLERAKLVSDFWQFRNDAQAIRGSNYGYLMASCAYSVASQKVTLNDFPYLVAFELLTHIKADAVDFRAGKRPHRVVSEVYPTLHSRLKLPKETIDKTGEEIIEEMLKNGEDEGSPRKKRRTEL